MARKTYTHELKLSTVRTINQQGCSAAEATRKLVSWRTACETGSNGSRNLGEHAAEAVGSAGGSGAGAVSCVVAQLAWGKWRTVTRGRTMLLSMGRKRGAGGTTRSVLMWEMIRTMKVARMAHDASRHCTPHVLRTGLVYLPKSDMGKITVPTGSGDGLKLDPAFIRRHRPDKA